jgi:hypothetical protein
MHSNLGFSITKLPITQLPNFIRSFHAETCGETLSLSITSLSGAPAFHSLLTDCTLPADGLPYMLP